MTIAQVADSASVSPSAASKALRGRYGVSAALRAAVLEAAESLGYRTRPTDLPAKHQERPS